MNKTIDHISVPTKRRYNVFGVPNCASSDMSGTFIAIPAMYWRSWRRRKNDERKDAVQNNEREPGHLGQPVLALVSFEGGLFER